MPNRVIAQYRMRHLLVWLILVYGLARILQAFSMGLPMLGVVALHVMAPAAFAFLHGCCTYGWRGIAVFFATCLLVGNVMENIGVRTGVPYGRYYFTDVMGPKIYSVPILLGLAYIGIAYASWCLAKLILLGSNSEVSRRVVFSLPLLASLIMVAWDLSQDAVWATVLHAWIWIDGGLYFGVPLSNFFGWFLTVYIIFQLFAFFVTSPYAKATQPSIDLDRLMVALYSVCALGNLMEFLPRGGSRTVTDASGTQWSVMSIMTASAFVSLFIMGAVAYLAWIRLSHRVSDQAEAFSLRSSR